MKLLLLVYPRRWRERYADELLALLEAEPLTRRVPTNVAAGGLRERLRSSGPPGSGAVSVVCVRRRRHGVPEDLGALAGGHPCRRPRNLIVAFDVLQAAAAIGSAAVLLGIALALPAFLRDLRSGGWSTLRGAILCAHTYVALTVAAATVVMAIAAAVWFAAVSGQAPSFVGAAQLAVTATFMLAGTPLAATGAVGSLVLASAGETR